MTLFVIGCIMGFIIAFAAQAALRRDLTALQERFAALSRDVALLRERGPKEAPKPEPVAPAQDSVEAAPPAVVTPPPAVTATPPVVTATPPRPRAPEPAHAASANTNFAHADFERQFGGRAFVWIGGIALALAGFFLVKYSIEMGILTESVRVGLGLSFGVALLAGGHVVRRLKNLADGTRIAQALTGAGIADLYGSLFAATTLYHLFPAVVGFAAMAVVTGYALLVSLRYGAPIAVLGLIGGFTTPLLIHGDPNTPLLFGYLYLVSAGLLAVARGRGWWWLPLPSLLLSFAWVITWAFFVTDASNAIVLPLFLLAIAATAMGIERDSGQDGVLQIWLPKIAPAGALVALVAVAFGTHFALFDWASFGLLSAAALVLNFFKPQSYRGVPWLALIANLVMIAGWHGAAAATEALVITGFAVLFGAGAQLLIRKSSEPLTWAGMSAATALSYFALAYDKLEYPLREALGKSSADFVWAAIASIAAAFFAFALTETWIVNRDAKARGLLQAIYAATATALVSIALAILLTQDYFALAAASEVLALSWIATRLDVPALRPIAMVVTGLFGLLLLKALGHDYTWGDENSFWRLITAYALPAGLLAAASLHWRRQQEDRYTAMLELGAGLLIAVFADRSIVTFTHGFDDTGAFAIGALQTAVMLGLALGYLHLAKVSGLHALNRAGRILAAWGALRVILTALIVHNPLMAHQWVGVAPLANAVALAYGAPAVLFTLIGRHFDDDSNWQRWSRLAAYGLGAITIILWIRQLFEGPYLNAAHASNAELYTYSAVGLIAGVALLLSAVARRDAMMRVASLVVMLATVGKVFLYDAAALSGLWRVVSFLGLGFSLLGLSWVYSRFVFKKD